MEEGEQEGICSPSEVMFECCVESKLLVIYTGGTIGMTTTATGALAPAEEALAKTLSRSTLFHDEYYESDSELFDGEKGFLVLPNPRKKRILYQILQYDELIDSSNINFDHWSNLAYDIYKNYNKYDGFVVLHGTDTLAFTGSALSFICENLGKPIIVTGSQVPIFELMSDGRDNLVCSLLLAGDYNIPEVTVFFNHKLFRANRVTKLSCQDYDAFESFNLPPLATVGVNITVDTQSVLKPCTPVAFKVHTNLNQNVSLLRFHPGMSLKIVCSHLVPPVEGLVLQTYGAGNMPSNREDILEQVRSAVSRGLIVINCTQCLRGPVSTIYQTGQVLKDIGVISGGDMTPEAALTKLAYVLSKDEWTFDIKKKKLQQNLRGEMTSRTSTLEEEDMITAVARSLGITSHYERQQLENLLFPSLLFTAIENEKIDQVKHYIDHGADINAKNFDSRTPLHLACCKGNLKIVQYLLLNGASVHAKDRYGQTPLMDALRYCHQDTILVLIENGAHLSGNQWINNLSRAVIKGQIQKVKCFLIANADLNIINSDGRTLLHQAVLHDQPDIVRILLESGVDPCRTDALDMTPGQLAHTLRRPRLQELLTSPQN